MVTEMGNIPWRIRPAALPDVPRIVEFNQGLAWETEKLRLDPEVLRAGVERAVTDVRCARYYVADLDGEVIGQIMHTWEWSDWRNGYFWWLQSVYVAAEHRRNGVFRSLFEHVRELARQDSTVVGVRLYVEHHNTRAARTYDSLGMQSAGYQVLELVWRGLPQLDPPRS